ncbi:protein tyrosine phosphatase [Erythrobacter sp. HI0063]|jgi:protein tyrosine/serine phosphatase|uniref:tyrosine-protein phosphatase n=1 Tax=Erythrobacter sp. HI0063 TaxID=1822240 RepID=UPI0007C3189A|nr:tyrosine-protein phosphatase [Erythrobacter sp. HI0063]KZY56560.1 protein tyrosine phosphatase [Erythrobacter sp. HI0063]
MQNPDPFLITEGIHNFRDFGGWLGADGRQVRTGLLYRSGQHVEASDADLAAIDALDIRTVIDLRGEGERARNPCRRVEGWDGDVLFYEGETSSSPPHMDITPETTTAEFARERMLAVYTRMPVNPAMQTMFARYLRALVERDGASLVHCFAGKDRTGIAATLVLHILGVSEADQRAEFLRTNDAPTIDVLRRQSVPGIEARLGRTLDEEGIRALLEVHGDYLDRFHAIVNESYGSLDAWLEAEIGVDDALREALRERYLT